MCGIAGIISLDKTLVQPHRIKAATDAIAHRGPEGEGHWFNANNTVALGHRRLSIIDLSSCAAQPFHYANRYSMVYNGEIYNYVEIRKDLLAKGFSLTSSSDTEVVVAAYAAYGSNCLQHFDGAFAFAIWDEEKGELFAARDRFGEKPFYFFYDETQLFFASEMKALWQAGIPKEVNHALLYNFLTIGYNSNPAEPGETFYSNIQQLPPASFLSYKIKEQQLSIEKYWELQLGETSVTESEAIEQLTHLLATSVNRRLRSDVPIGTSLSGGLDSSAIVAFCSQESAAQYTHKCFTATFPHFKNDETAYAKQVADSFGLQHHLVAIEPGDVVKKMEEVQLHQEQPIASASPLAQYAVYEAAKKNGVTVLLDGQGADEIAAGYHKYYKWYWQQLYQQKKLSSSGELAAARTLGITENFGLQNKVAALLPQWSAAMLQARKEKNAAKLIDLNSDFRFQYKQSLYYSTPAHFDLNSVLYFNTVVHGLPELLHLADRNSAAHAVEVRLPFLNHQLVAYLFSLPAHYKIKQGWTKWLLRKMAEPLLPQNIVWRKDKVGFEPPQKAWMEQPDVQEAIRHGKEILVNQQVLNTSALTKKIKPHTAYAADAFDWRYWSASFLFRP